MQKFSHFLFRTHLSYMPYSASALVSELIGDSSEDYYSEEDEYYDEYYDDIIPSIKKKEQISVVKPLEMVMCDVCRIDIPVATYEGHKNSKKHRGAMVDHKIEVNREKQRLKAEALQRIAMKLFVELCSHENIMEKVLIMIFIVVKWC